MDRKLRDDWRKMVVSTDEWNLHINSARPANPGEAGGFYVKSQQSGAVAYLKPRKQDPNENWRHAAHEKIASDLAYEVDFNVPPVMLYQRTGTPPDEPTEVSLSLLVAGQVHELNEMCVPGAADGGIAQWPALLRIVKFVFSAAAEHVAFDAWLGETDHQNPRNFLVVCEENTLASLYFLDYSNSMDFNGGWSGGNHLRFSKVAIPPAFASCLTRERVCAGAEKIVEIPDGTVEEIIKRIPNQFMAQEKRDSLVGYLIARKSKLNDEFDSWYPGP